MVMYYKLCIMLWLIARLITWRKRRALACGIRYFGDGSFVKVNVSYDSVIMDNLQLFI